MKHQNRYNAQSAYVPAQSTRPSWLDFLFGWLRRTGNTQPVQTPDRTDPAIIYVSTPPHVWQLRQRGKEARMLLSRYLDGWPTSRREWIKAGHKEGAWKRARRILLKAGIIDRDGALLAERRKCRFLLESHLDEVEQQCWQCRRFIAPW